MSGPRIVLNAGNALTGRDINYVLNSGTTSEPRVYYVRLGAEKDVEVVTTLFCGRDTYLACLFVYESSVFLESNNESLLVLAPASKLHQKNKWDRVLLPKSTERRQVVLRLRPLDVFIYGKERFELNYHDENDGPFDSQNPIVNLSGDSQQSMGGYEKTRTTDHLEYLSDTSGPSSDSPTPLSGLELKKENDKPAPEVVEKKPRAPVTIDDIMEVAKILPPDHPAYPHQYHKMERQRVEAFDSDATVENDFTSSGLENAVTKWLDLAIPQVDGAVDDPIDQASAQAPRPESESTDDEQATPQASTAEIESSDEGQKFPVNSSPVDHSTFTVLESSTKEFGDDGLGVDKTETLEQRALHADERMLFASSANTSADNKGLPLSQESTEVEQPDKIESETRIESEMPPPPMPTISKRRPSPSEASEGEKSAIHESIKVQQRDTSKRGKVAEENDVPPPSSPVISRKRSSLSSDGEDKGDEVEHSIRESIEVQPRDAPSEPPKKKMKSSSESKPSATPSTPRPPSKSMRSSKSQPRSNSRERSTSSSGASIAAVHKKTRQEKAVSTPSKSLRNSNERERVAQRDPQIVFSSNISIQNKPAMMKFLKDQGVTAVEEMEEATMFCVGKGELKKTARLINAIVSGKDIVTDSWVTDSVKARRLLDVKDYIPVDKNHEKEWGFKLGDAVQRGKDGYKPLKGFRVYFSKALTKAGGAELKEIAILAGAEYRSAQIKKPEDNFLVVLTDDDDADAEKLVDKGFRCYAKELLTLGLLREECDLNSTEFQIMLGTSSEEL